MLNWGWDLCLAVSILVYACLAAIFNQNSRRKFKQSAIKLSINHVSMHATKFCRPLEAQRICCFCLIFCYKISCLLLFLVKKNKHEWQPFYFNVVIQLTKWLHQALLAWVNFDNFVLQFWKLFCLKHFLVWLLVMYAMHKRYFKINKLVVTFWQRFVICYAIFF